MSFSFIFGQPDFHCVDCDAEITLDQYRRKVPRCDECETDCQMALLLADLNGPEAP